MGTAIVNIIKAIGNLPNTFWGILVLFASMWIAVHYNSNVGYYFAGVGSTLLGINHLNQEINTQKKIQTPQAEEITNASNSTN